MHPLMAQDRMDAVSRQSADLAPELREYGTIREGKFPVEAMREAVNLPELLTEARIAQGLTQKELADQLGLKEQQIQRYETTDYATASGLESRMWPARSVWNPAVPPIRQKSTTEGLLNWGHKMAGSTRRSPESARDGCPDRLAGPLYSLLDRCGK